MKLARTSTGRKRAVKTFLFGAEKLRQKTGAIARKILNIREEHESGVESNEPHFGQICQETEEIMRQLHAKELAPEEERELLIELEKKMQEIKDHLRDNPSRIKELRHEMLRSLGGWIRLYESGKIRDEYLKAHLKKFVDIMKLGADERALIEQMHG